MVYNFETGIWGFTGRIELMSRSRIVPADAQRAYAHTLVSAQEQSRSGLGLTGHDVQIGSGLIAERVPFVITEPRFDVPSFSLHALAARAEYERKLISERTRAGLGKQTAKLAAGETWIAKRSGRAITKVGRPKAAHTAARARAGLQRKADGTAQRRARISRALPGAGPQPMALLLMK